MRAEISWGGVLLAVDVDGPIGADVALDGADRAVRVGDRLTLGDLADQDVAVLEGDDRGGGAGTLGVGDDCGLAPFEGGDDTVGGAKVDSYRAGHW